MPPLSRKAPVAPTGWEFGVVLRPRSGISDRVMFVRMTDWDTGPSKGLAYFEGLTVKTDERGQRIGKTKRIDHFPVNGWRLDES